MNKNRCKPIVVTLSFREALTKATRQNFLRDYRHFKSLRYEDWSSYRFRYLWDTAQLCRSNNKNYLPETPDTIHYHVEQCSAWEEMKKAYPGNRFMEHVVSLAKQEGWLEHLFEMTEIPDSNSEVSIAA